MVELSTINIEPLLAPSGTPFLGVVSNGLPQLVVRTAHLGDLESWWFLNGSEWLRADDKDVRIIGGFVPVPLIDADECDCDCGLCDDE